ncbi:MAG: hypothetical protein QNJ38_05465 [Prochloraceae cyanobacterium]|nr:hypothetical protein [Prochloraceae cyanobacterium]
MNPIENTSFFQQAIETVESLPEDAQQILVDIIQKRLKQKRRDELVQEVAAAEEDYARGEVKYGSVDDLMAELEC